MAVLYIWPEIPLWPVHGEQHAIVPLDIGRRLQEAMPTPGCHLPRYPPHSAGKSGPNATLAEIEGSLSRN